MSRPRVDNAAVTEMNPLLVPRIVALQWCVKGSAEPRLPAAVSHNPIGHSHCLQKGVASCCLLLHLGACLLCPLVLKLITKHLQTNGKGTTLEIVDQNGMGINWG